MKKVKRILCLSVLIIANVLTIEAAVIKGCVKDETGEAVIGANIKVAGTNISVVTDVNGEYEIVGVKNGKTTIEIDALFYESLKQSIDVKGQQTVEFTMKPQSQTLNEVVVTGEMKKNSDIGMLAAQKYSFVAQNGVSAQQISKTQDRNASEVIKRIPGISIIDEKFVMVRGLSQRYNNVWINHSAVPSSEADSRSFSFDIIPSSQLDNVVIVKSPAPEYPADFSGGFILVNTKDIPQKNSFNIGLGLELNEKTHFKDYYHAKGSGTDFLGFDNGLRSLSHGIKTKLNKLNTGENDFDLLNNGFNNDWKISRNHPLPNLNINADMSHHWSNDDGKTLAMLASVNYSNKYQTLTNMENAMFGAYNQNTHSSTYLRHSVDNQYNNYVKLGAMFNLVYVPSNGLSKYEFRNIFNQLSRDRYTERKGVDAQSNNEESAEYYYTSRTTYNGQFSGRHTLTDVKMLDWSAGYAYANNCMPDRRRYVVNDAHTLGQIELTNSNDISRDFTRLDEHIGSLNVNYKDQYNIGSVKLELKVGGYGEYRSRNYYTRSFYYVWNSDNNLPEGFRQFDIANELLQDKYYGADGLYLQEQVKWSNNYGGNNKLFAGYVGVNLPFKNFNIYAGVRYENNGMELIGNSRDYEESHNSHHYNNSDFFPSVNAAYHINKKNTVRLSYGRTVNRPEFREVSPSVYYDFDLASDVQGNYNLQSAYIDNMDLRYEIYPNTGELISLSLFYKKFKNPIEWTYTVSGGTDLIYSYENAKGADNYGIELEVKKDLDFIGMKNFSLNINGALIKSTVNFAEGSKNETRAMQGQSPYLINLGLFYNNPQIDMNVALLYNRIGKRIIGVGRSLGSGDNVVNIPDSYEMPRNSLDLSASKMIGKSWEIKLSLRNLLSEKVIYKQFEDDSEKGKIEQTTRSFNLGRNYGLSVNYKF